MSQNDAFPHIDPLSRGALRHDIVRKILRAIYQGELPAGSRMATKSLAVRLGVSATPVREALVALEQIGMVELMHNRGALIKPFGRQELREIFQVRRILESEGARLACGHVDEAVIAELRAMAEQVLRRASNGDSDGEWIATAITLDDRVHTWVAERCGVRRLADEIARYRVLAEALLDRLSEHPDMHRTGTDAHLALLDALRDNRPEGAAHSMSRHLEVVAKAAEAAIFDK